MSGKAAGRKARRRRAPQASIYLVIITPNWKKTAGLLGFQIFFVTGCGPSALIPGSGSPKTARLREDTTQHPEDNYKFLLANFSTVSSYDPPKTPSPRFYR